ncbi:MAG: lysine--tRNA ligase [Angelakisella sp.]
MHWSEEIAAKIIERSPHKEEYVCAAGISPSGSIHIGNFRDIATSYFVCKALRKMGKKARLLFSWDEFDRLRKIPVNVSAIDSDMEQFIGKPYADVKDPFGCCESYAQHFENEFEQSLKKFGVDVDFRRQAGEYRSGRYVKYILEAIAKRREIFDILDSFRTQEATPDEREAYYPVSIYCPVCGKDETTIHAVSEDCTKAEYSCTCGHKGDFDFTTNFNCKLAWKVDWPMRWMVESVDFEPGGKDHAAPTGSYQTSRIISEKIFGYPAPLFQGYEFIGIKGLTGKMSGSTGLNLTPDTLLKLYQPEVILWLYSKTEPNKAFDFCFDDEILRQYFEFDKMYNQYLEGGDNEYLNGIMYNTDVNGRKLCTVPMAQLVSFGSIVDFNPAMLETIFEKMGTPYKVAEFGERLALARFWLEQCSPESINRLLEKRNWQRFDAMSSDEKQEIALLRNYLLQKDYTLEELNSYLYAIPGMVNTALDDKSRKAAQGRFFKNVYQLTLGREKGPRLYLFLFAIELERFVDLLDFSGAREAYEELPAVEQPADTGRAPAVPAAQPNDPVCPVKEQISAEQFRQLDLRVCRVVNCEEVKKSRACYKLTLADGLGERVIMSSIKDEYRPEQLIGRKIIVVANLAPAKFSGVVSQGMLLAGTANSCGCQVVFVDDSIPEGTAIC